MTSDNKTCANCGIILKHKGPIGGDGAYDFFIKKEFYKKFEYLKEYGYDVSCTYKNKFLEENKDFVFLFSDDLNHIPSINDGVRSLISDLLKKGFKLLEAPNKPTKEEIMEREKIIDEEEKGGEDD